MSRAKLVLELLQHGQIVFRLFEGESVVAGRGRESDWILHDGSISRSHARLTWGMHADPQVVDLESQNGTFLAGEQLPPDHPTQLLDGQVLSLGALDYEVRVGALSFAPASIMDSDTPPDPLRGRFRGWPEIRSFLLSLEATRQTGTFLISRPEGQRHVTVFLGSLVLDAAAGVGLLKTLAAAPASVRYAFTSKLEIGTQPTVGCLPSELIQTWENGEGTHSTHRYARDRVVPTGPPDVASADTDSREGETRDDLA